MPKILQMVGYLLDGPNLFKVPQMLHKSGKRRPFEAPFIEEKRQKQGTQKNNTNQKMSTSLWLE